MPTLTVIIPTFDNIDTLRYSIPSVLNQTYGDFELCIVGDGCPSESRNIIEEFALQDKRVKFFDFAKGARHGELHRHTVITQTTSPYITYLSDDDLYVPEHLSTVVELLQGGYEFVHTLSAEIIPYNFPPESRFSTVGEFPEVRVLTHPGSLSHGWGVGKILRGENFISLSNAAHTRALYERLPFGWRTTPEGTFTDLYMWQQFFSLEPRPKAYGANTLSHIHLAKVLRRNWSREERLKELQWWSEAISNDACIKSVQEAALHNITYSMFDSLQEKEQLQADKQELQEDNQELKKALHQVTEEFNSFKQSTISARVRRLFTRS